MADWTSLPHAVADIVLINGALRSWPCLRDLLGMIKRSKLAVEERAGRSAVFAEHHSPVLHCTLQTARLGQLAVQQQCTPGGEYGHHPGCTTVLPENEDDQGKRHQHLPVQTLIESEDTSQVCKPAARERST